MVMMMVTTTVDLSWRRLRVWRQVTAAMQRCEGSALLRREFQARLLRLVREGHGHRERLWIRRQGRLVCHCNKRTVLWKPRDLLQKLPAALHWRRRFVWVWPRWHIGLFYYAMNVFFLLSLQQIVCNFGELRGCRLQKIQLFVWLWRRWTFRQNFSKKSSPHATWFYIRMTA